MYRSIAMGVVVVVLFVGICLGGWMDHHFAMEVVREREATIGKLDERVDELRSKHCPVLHPVVKHKVHHEVRKHRDVVRPTSKSQWPFSN